MRGRGRASRRTAARRASRRARACCRRRRRPSSRGAGARSSRASAVESLDAQPAEEDVAGGLHQPLAGDDAPAVVGERALADEALEHRGLRLLRLQEQRVVCRRGPRKRWIQARVPTLPTPTTLRAVWTYLNSSNGMVVDPKRLSVRAIERAACRRRARRARRPRAVRSSSGTISGGSATIRSSPSISPVRFAKHAACCRGSSPSRCPSRPRFGLLLAEALLADLRARPVQDLRRRRRGRTRRRGCASRRPCRIIAAVLARRRRITIARRSAGSNPRSRPRTSKLAASRFTSHSHGPGSVSSKSLMSNSSCRSGEPNTPKFDRCASPHSCTLIPDRAWRRGRPP